MTASGVRPNVTDEQLARIPLIVDLDAHLVEPPDLWTSRLPSRWGDMIPHVKWDAGQELQRPSRRGWLRHLLNEYTRTCVLTSSGRNDRAAAKRGTPWKSFMVSSSMFR